VLTSAVKATAEQSILRHVGGLLMRISRIRGMDDPGDLIECALFQTFIANARAFPQPPLTDGTSLDTEVDPEFRTG
jgi:hypothetical protein